MPSENFRTELREPSARRMVDIDVRCLVVESNFLISLDLIEILRSLGFELVDHAADKVKANELLQNASYDFAFIDIDHGEDIARQIASQTRLNGGTVIFTSTMFEHDDMPAGLGEFKLFPKPYSISVLRDILELK